jgi:hypothetical protein
MGAAGLTPGGFPFFGQSRAMTPALLDTAKPLC